LHQPPFEGIQVLLLEEQVEKPTATEERFCAGGFRERTKSPDLPFSNSDSEPAQELIKFASCKLPGFL